jgi:hypothetical protein
MENKIILKNYADGKDFSDYLNPEKPFNITNQTCFFLGEKMISPESAKKRAHQIEVDEKFLLPAGIDDRVKVSSYIENVLGISRQRDHDLYFKLWKKMGESLEHGRLVLGKNKDAFDK